MQRVAVTGATIKAWGPSLHSQNLGAQVLVGKQLACMQVIAANPGFLIRQHLNCPILSVIMPDVYIICNETN